MGRKLAITAIAAAIFIVASGPRSATAGGMMWSTFFGGSGTDRMTGVTSDASGNIYVVGTSTSTNLPATSGGFRSTATGWGDVVVAKFNSTGTVLQWVARLGGSYLDDGRGIALDPAGNVVVTGSTASSDFPTTPGAYRRTFGGYVDAFVAKLSPTGALLFSTFLGGYGQDWANAMKLDASGNVVVAGWTDSYNFPTTAGVVKPGRAPYFTDASDGFIAKLSASGGSLIYSSYFGSPYAADGITGLALDSSGQPVVTGWTSRYFPTTQGAYDRTPDYYQEGFVARLNASATGFNYSTYLGGANVDNPLAVGVDAAGNAYVTGYTASTNFPVTPGARQQTSGGGWDGFLVKITPSGSSLAYATFLGGAGNDRPTALSVTPGGDVYITGATSSANFPVTAGASEGTLNGGTDAFVAHFSPTGQLVYSSYLGSNGTDGGAAITIQAGNIALVVGQTTGGNFPSTLGVFDNTQNGAGTADAFVSCWNLGQAAMAADQSSLESQTGAQAQQILSAPQPNPFRDQTMFRMSLATPTRVKLRVRDLQGRLVRNLADEAVSPGLHTWAWDGRGDGGESAAPGVYFVEMSVGGVSSTRTVTRLR